jgi:hypothetical protein
MEVSLELQKLRIREGLDIVVVENDAAFVSFAADQVCGVIKDKLRCCLGASHGQYAYRPLCGTCEALSSNGS